MNNSFITETEIMDLSALDSVFASSEDILTAETPFTETPGPTNILEDNSVDSTLDVDPEKFKKVAESSKSEIAIDDKKTSEILDNVAAEFVAETNADQKQVQEETKGRPKTDKNALVSYLAQKVEANDFGIPEDAPFDPKKQTLAEYLGSLPEKELHSLLDSNLKAKEDEVRAQTPKEFFDSLPEELQYAAAYVAEGGQDMKALFRALSHVEEVKALDPEVESDQEAITRNYLMATGWKDNQINEQVEEWKEAGKLAKKAVEFKPALDDMQKQQVEAHIRQANEQKQRQQELAKFYAQNVYKTLENNEIAGIKVDKRVAKDMADGLLTVAPGPWSGRPVNSLGAALEKIQYIEPDYETVVLINWLANDKQGFLDAIGTAKANKAVAETAKLIKMNQGIGVSESPAQNQKPVKRIPNNTNVLKRTT